MKLSEDQKNQVRKDLIEFQVITQIIQKMTVVPESVKNAFNIMFRLMESQAIAANVFVVESEVQ